MFVYFIQSNTWSCFVLIIYIYASCKWVILTLCHLYNWPVSMLVNHHIVVLIYHLGFTIIETFIFITNASIYHTLVSTLKFTLWCPVVFKILVKIFIFWIKTLRQWTNVINILSFEEISSSLFYSFPITYCLHVIFKKVFILHI